ncbi:hypothetical protein F511_32294 [Dorcoceras hygrometricum]|uniref:Dystroglycan-like n=1 Tax=Dorcoceras hygrometricum TaxID=472368 RepID=A0A2Z7CSV6_9LAMI|nr:hypothetical protein F511_32294 [Dorcoceras hygrometricum]
MAASFYSNSVHVDFESALAMGAPDMVSMFQALISSGLQGFLGCPAVVYEDALVEFFANGTVRDGLVVSTVNGVAIEISEKLFTETFDLPVDGLADISEMPKDKIFDARSIVSLTGEPVTLSGLKSQMKMHYRLLCDIMAKSISVKARSFNAITVEKFSLLTAVVCDVKMNWGSVLFGILKKMVTPGTNQAKGFAIQISLLLESVPNLELGESSEFPSSKILTDKTIHRDITVIDKSGAQEPADAPKVKKAPRTKAETEDAADRPAAEEETPADRPADEIVNVEQRVDESAVEVSGVDVVDPEIVIQQVLNQLDLSTEGQDVTKGDRVETWFDRALAEEIATAGGDSPTEKANDEIPWFVRPFLSADHDNERLFETGSDSAAAMDFEVHSQNLPVVKDTYVDPAGEQEIPVFEEHLVDSVNEEEMQDKTSSVVSADVPRVPLALAQHQSSPNFPDDSSMLFDETDIDATATAPAFSLPGSSTVSLDITKALNQLQASLDQISHRDDGAAFKDTILMHLRDIEKKFTARFDAQDRWIGALRNDSNDQRNLLSLEFKSSHRQLHTQIAASTIDQIDMQREMKELNAKVDVIATNLERVKRDAEATKEAILHQIFEFQSQAQADHLILTTQLGQLVEDLNRGGNDKKGEGVSSRGPQPTRARVPVRVERRPLPTREPSPDAQSSGQYLSAEQAAEFVSEMNRLEFDRLERERRERRQSSSSAFKRRRRY